ncbi:hypothetical protein BJ944DRAFT_250674 [Cunninghamella echinulata]|nr:hypothetical protein BJ944DRAFT_250674 [Cunninghamella echinulata]
MEGTSLYDRNNHYSEHSLPSMINEVSPEQSYPYHSHPIIFHSPYYPPPPPSRSLSFLRRKQLKVLECILKWKDKKQMNKYPPPPLYYYPPPPHHHHPTMVQPIPLYYYYHSIPPFHPFHYYYSSTTFDRDDKTQVNDNNDEDSDDNRRENHHHDHGVQIVSIPSSPNTFHNDDLYPHHHQPYIVTNT